MYVIKYLKLLPDFDDVEAEEKALDHVEAYQKTFFHLEHNARVLRLWCISYGFLAMLLVKAKSTG